MSDFADRIDAHDAEMRRMEEEIQPQKDVVIFLARLQAMGFSCAIFAKGAGKEIKLAVIGSGREHAQDLVSLKEMAKTL